MNHTDISGVKSKKSVYIHAIVVLMELLLASVIMPMPVVIIPVMLQMVRNVVLTGVQNVKFVTMMLLELLPVMLLP